MAKLLSGTRIYGTGTVDTQLFVSGTNSTTSTLTGAIVVTGGAGIGGGLFVGGTVTATQVTVNGFAVSTGTNITGGSAGAIVYQSAANTTAFIGTGTLGSILQMGATTATFVTTASIYVNRSTLADTATNVSAGSANQVLYKNASNITTGSSGLQYDGTNVSVNGNLISTFSSGDEGGEVQLAKPVTNTTLAGAVSIDIYQNRLRFFENGGTTRGYYIDITTGGAGAGTNLVGGGGGFTGSVGFTGSAGSQGTTGFTGSAGSQGTTGFTGSVGSQGTTGFTGSVGSQGTTGFTGSLGFTGSTGTQGIIGFTGSVGFTGSSGSFTNPFSSILTITNTTAVSSTITGALQVSGGVGIGGGIFVASISTLTNTTNATSTITGALQVAGGMGVGRDLWVGAGVYATTKSFLIDHPSKPGWKLVHGSLEGPENGVYVRGRVTGSNKIHLPTYWANLVDFDTVTVTLTPMGRYQQLFVKKIKGLEITVANALNSDMDFFYVVWAERIDVDKIRVEVN